MQWLLILILFAGPAWASECEDLGYECVTQEEFEVKYSHVSGLVTIPTEWCLRCDEGFCIDTSRMNECERMGGACQCKDSCINPLPQFDESCGNGLSCCLSFPLRIADIFREQGWSILIFSPYGELTLLFLWIVVAVFLLLQIIPSFEKYRIINLYILGIWLAVVVVLFHFQWISGRSIVFVQMNSPRAGSIVYYPLLHRLIEFLIATLVIFFPCFFKNYLALRKGVPKGYFWMVKIEPDLE